MGNVRDRASELVSELSAGGLSVTDDPGAASALLPCVLIVPPVLARQTYASKLVTWRLFVLADAGAGPVESWQALDDTLDQLSDLVAWDTAEPTGYLLPSGTDLTPAYLVTYTESL